MYVYSLLGCMVCGFFIIRKKRRRLRYSIEEESREVRSSVQRNTVSSNKNYRYREDSSRCKIGSYTPRTLDFSDLPPWFSTPIEVGARMAFSFDGHSTTDNALRSPPGHGEKATRSLSMTMTRMSYFSNATEIVGKSSSRSTLWEVDVTNDTAILLSQERSLWWNYLLILTLCWNQNLADTVILSHCKRYFMFNCKIKHHLCMYVLSVWCKILSEILKLVGYTTYNIALVPLAGVLPCTALNTAEGFTYMVSTTYVP